MPITARTQALLITRRQNLEAAVNRENAIAFASANELELIESLLGGGVTIPSVSVGGIGSLADPAAPPGGGDGELVAQSKRTNLNLEEIRDRLSSSSASSEADIGLDQSIVATQQIILPELDTGTPANTANPVITALNAATTSGIIIWRPSDSYFDNAGSNAAAASVVLDAVCWTIDGSNPAAAPSVRFNQSGLAGTKLSRALLLNLRAGAHIQAGGDPVFLSLIELDGIATENLRLLPSTIDAAGVTIGTASTSSSTVSTPRSITIPMLAPNDFSNWVALPNTSNKFGSLLVPDTLPAAATSLTLRIRPTGSADADGFRIFNSDGERTITIPSGGKVSIEPDELSGLFPYYGGNHEVQIRSNAAMTQTANFILNTP